MARAVPRKRAMLLQVSALYRCRAKSTSRAAPPSGDVVDDAGAMVMMGKPSNNGKVVMKDKSFGKASASLQVTDAQGAADVVMQGDARVLKRPEDPLTPADSKEMKSCSSLWSLGSESSSTSSTLTGFDSFAEAAGTTARALMLKLVGDPALQAALGMTDEDKVIQLAQEVFEHDVDVISDDDLAPQNLCGALASGNAPAIVNLDEEDHKGDLEDDEEDDADAHDGEVDVEPTHAAALVKGEPVANQDTVDAAADIAADVADADVAAAAALLLLLLLLLLLTSPALATPAPTTTTSATTTTITTTNTSKLLLLLFLLLLLRLLQLLILLVLLLPRTATSI